ncbi:MAG: Glu/Leu/Phe/Val dehydrogenase dimerization domain-containing protein [Dehalococcoidia bacterium]
MKGLEYMAAQGYEQLVKWTDQSVGLKALIAIHDTALGPACGGVRVWPYGSEEEAIRDVLRLARAMTYKSAAADLSLGGGKAVVIADSKTQKTQAMLMSLGRFVDTMRGRYIACTDVGTNSRDMVHIRQETKHVVGLPRSSGGSGDTSIMTGLGIYNGMKACAREVWGSDSLKNKRIAVQGFGKVATRTAYHLLKEGARLVVTDINRTALDNARRMCLKVVSPDAIYDVECDIFCPCALGGALNTDTIPRLRCQVIAGGANNQLQTVGDGEELYRLGILYAPDYIINAGGIINVAAEIGAPYNPDRARRKTELIYETMQRVIEISKREKISTSKAADRLAEERLGLAKPLRSPRTSSVLSSR